MTETLKYEVMSNLSKMDTAQSKYDFLASVHTWAENQMKLLIEKNKIPMAEVVVDE